MERDYEDQIRSKDNRVVELERNRDKNSHSAKDDDTTATVAAVAIEAAEAATAKIEALQAQLNERRCTHCDDRSGITSGNINGDEPIDIMQERNEKLEANNAKRLVKQLSATFVFDAKSSSLSPTSSHFRHLSTYLSGNLSALALLRVYVVVTYTCVHVIVLWTQGM